ncbi:kirola-like [Andrographis paniculata]|uniref:kirola-like n=1 Tax=Andrographis paniculata TaxID=175694 RepID=UPI0021E96405|nr:kirola-like [Andrographis paniculata]
MASLPCKLVGQVAFKAGGDVFNAIFTNNAPHMTKITPSKFQSCVLHQGSFDTNGSILEWKYTLDGKEGSCKQVIENLDKEKRQLTYKFIDGDLLELYKTFSASFHVETKNGVDYVTWTLDYELLKPDNPHPVSVLNFVIGFTTDIEAHIFGA